MNLHVIIYLVLGLWTFSNFVSGRNIEHKRTQSNNFEQLDDEGKFLLAWEAVDDEIIFEIEAETLGFVGFGISPQGGMTGADIFIGGVDSQGTPYYSDRFGTGFTEPKIDDHSDWTLLEATELSSTGKTILKVSRKLNTCDDEDFPIGNDTSRLIYAMGASDTVQYHGPSSRGTRSTNLLHADLPDLELDKLTPWSMVLEMEMPSNQDTTYWCSFHKGPSLDKKHQIVAFDALLETEDSLKYTHHFMLYHCLLPADSNQTLDDVFGELTVDKGVLGDHCFDEQHVTLPIAYCRDYVYVWSKGGKQAVLPPNVGYPIGETPGNSYYMLEIHYDNPEQVAGKTFPSGVQFYYTDEIREHDAGLITLGHKVDVTLTVPPNTTDYKVVGHCSSECLDKFPDDGITIFNSVLHSHLSGRKIKTRHFRGNVELPWLDSDDHFDFDYQQNKPLVEHRKILKGDQLTVECTYDSTWKNNGEIVIGGFSTREEMCENLVWYYPKFGITVCGSDYYFEEHMKEFGITKYRTEPSNTLNNYIIEEPEELAGDYFDSISFKFNWTEEFTQVYTDKRQNGEHKGDCVIHTTGEMWFFPVGYPENLVPYVPDDFCAA